MVVFVCNACGDTIKKSEVEKHSNRCNNCDSVSCIDCNKDFFGNEYKGHDSCMTEAEKYSGKDYIPKVPKSLGKQEEWAKRFKIAITSASLPPHLKSVSAKLRTTGVPMRKTKFVNYVTNSIAGSRSPECVALAEELFNFVTEFQQEDTNKKKKAKPNSAGKDENTKGSDKDESTSVTDRLNEVTLNTAKSQKAWIKLLRHNITTHKDKYPPNTEDLLNKLLERKDVPHKLKPFSAYMEKEFGVKKFRVACSMFTFIKQTGKQEKSGENGVADLQPVPGSGDSEGTVVSGMSKRERKLLRQQEQMKKQKKDQMPSDAEISAKNSEKKRKRKRKRSVQVEDEGEEIKKLKAERNDSAADVRTKAQVPVNSADKVAPKQHPKKFNWTHAIEEKMSSSKSDEIKLSRLKKMVINECVATCGVQTSDDMLEVYFKKALLRCKNLKMEKERVVKVLPTV